MVLSGDVYSKRRLLPLFPIVMICLMADMQVVIKPPSRYFKLPSIGQLHSKMFILMSGLVTAVKGSEVGQGGTKCPSTIFLRSKSLMFKMWTS